MTDSELLDGLDETLRGIASFVDRGRAGYDSTQTVRWLIQRLWIFAGNYAYTYTKRHDLPLSTWPWSDLIGFRGVIAHWTPDQVNDERVWRETVRDLPEMLDALARLRGIDRREASSDQPHAGRVHGLPAPAPDPPRPRPATTPPPRRVASAPASRNRRWPASLAGRTRRREPLCAPWRFGDVPRRRVSSVRVLHLTSSFPRDASDHVAPFLLDLARAQRAAGMEVAVLAPHDAHARRSEVMCGVAVHRFRYAAPRWERLAYRGGLLGRSRTKGGVLLLPVFFAAFTASALRLARRFRPDVLHAHWWLPAGLCGLLASRVTGAPLVVTLHGSDVHLLRNPAMRAVAKAVLRRAALVAVVSEDLRDVVVRRLDLAPEQVVVLRLPVQRVTAPAPLPATPPTQLLAAGRLSPEKGFDILLEALTLAIADGMDVRLDLVGSGPERGRLYRLAEPLGERVRMLPAQPRDLLWHRLDSAVALVVPSRREGLGLIALEAIARGRPVIASRAGGLPEVVVDDVDGILVAPEDPRALADALRRLPLPPPRGAALDRHAPAGVGREHQAAYERLLHHHRHLPSTTP